MAGKKVTHIITGLGKGGAETMLYQIVKFRANELLEYKVVSLGGSSYFEGAIRDMGVPVEVCPIKKKPFSSIIKIIQAVKGSDTLCCWMMHANLVGFFAAKAAGVKRIVWCVRHSNTGRTFLKPGTARVDSICARLSRKVDCIAYNGNRSRKAYESLGFCKEKGIVVDNGCDCGEYCPDPSARKRLGGELGICDEKTIVLAVTKNTQIKDIPTFIRAFGILHEKRPETVTVMCGSGVEENASMLELCREAGLEVERDIYLLGLRHDVPYLLAACGLYVLHSAGEAFPNTLLQAMSAACLCVATDVGDARRMLGNDRFIVPPQAPLELADKMEEAIRIPEGERDAIRMENRKRVEDYFDIHHIVKKYEDLYS